MPEEVQASTTRALDAGTYLANHMHEVPLIAVFCFNPGIMTITDIDQPRTSVVGGGSVYPAVQNFLLSCRNEGLGCVLTTLLCYEEPAVKELLGIPGTGIPVRTFLWVIRSWVGMAPSVAVVSTKWSALTAGARSLFSIRPDSTWPENVVGLCHTCFRISGLS